MDQLHSLVKRSIFLTKEIVLVLVFCHYSALVELNCSDLPVTESVFYPNLAPVLDQLTLLRKHREHPRYNHPLIEYRCNKRGVIYIQDSAEPIKELAPGLELIRALSELAL